MFSFEAIALGANMTRSSRHGRGFFSAERITARCLGLLGAVVSLGTAAAEPAANRGIDIFDAACAACHVDGEEGAPRIGDRVVWSKRIAAGHRALSRKALEAIRRTASHNGDTVLKPLEFERAVVYMINESGGNWAEPAGVPQGSARNRGAQVVASHCALCHATGFAGAPRIGDRSAWLPRTKLGLDRLVHAARLGHGSMPPRGGEATLSDAELRSAVLYMIGSAGQVRRTGP